MIYTFALFHSTRADEDLGCGHFAGHDSAIDVGRVVLAIATSLVRVGECLEKKGQLIKGYVSS